MKNILFPTKCRIIGRWLFIAGLIASVERYYDLISLPGLAETIFNDAVIIAIAVGALFIVCSKEPQEDEMTRAIRLASMLNALYAYAGTFIAGTLVVNGVAYAEFVMMSLILLPIFLVFIYRADMYRYYKENADEEPDQD